jgi:hypothetical protein
MVALLHPMTWHVRRAITGNVTLSVTGPAVHMTFKTTPEQAAAVDQLAHSAGLSPVRHHAAFAVRRHGGQRAHERERFVLR